MKYWSETQMECDVLLYVKIVNKQYYCQLKCVHYKQTQRQNARQSLRRFSARLHSIKMIITT